jgi:hypothetical protein
MPPRHHTGRHRSHKERRLGANAAAPEQVATVNHCYHCGRAIAEPAKAISILIVESHSGRLGLARLHSHCCEPSLARYRQVVEWDGSTLGNLGAFKRLHRRLADMNESCWGSVPIVLT